MVKILENRSALNRICLSTEKILLSGPEEWYQVLEHPFITSIGASTVDYRECRSVQSERDFPVRVRTSGCILFMLVQCTANGYRID